MFWRSCSVLCLGLVVLCSACSSDGPSYVPCTSEADCAADETCFEGECRPASGCTSSEECTGGRLCINGYCRFGCTEDADCADLEHCADGVCVAGECRVNEDCEAEHFCDQDYTCQPFECVTDGDCAPTEYCNEGQCEERQVVDCTDDDGCLQDELCLDGTCQVPPSCSEDADCPSGTVCANGQCARPCLVNEDCPTLHECRDGHCLQQCLGDGTCQGDLICEDGVCMEPFCSQDEDCEGEYVRCRSGRCEEYTPCVDDEDCTDPNFVCIENICEELPGCTISGDCEDEDWCADNPCICDDNHCHHVPSCESDSDCEDDQDCVGEICVDFVCRGPDDCDPGLVCVGGECIDPGDPDSVYEVVILTPGGPIRPGQQIQLEALALTLNGQEVPGIGFDWDSSEPDRAAVDADGLLTGGTETDATLVTATAQGTSPPVTSDPVTFINIGDLPQDLLQVTVVDQATRNPVEGATVMLVSGQTSDNQPTDSEGIASFTDPQAAVDVHVFSDYHDYVSILGTTSVDILAPVPVRSEPSKAGGFTGQMTFSGVGDIDLGLAGSSIGGNLVDLNFNRLLGEIFTVTVENPIQSFQVSLPAQIVLMASYSGYPISIKPTYNVLGQRGLRTAWGMGGKLDFASLQDIIGSGSSPTEILIGMLPYFSVFDHGLKPNVDIFPIPRVADADDVDGDGDTTEMRPHWTGFNSVDLTPAQSQDMNVHVTIPTLPTYGSGRIQTAVLLAGAMNSYGLTPLGITAEQADVAGVTAPVMMKLAPAYGGLQVGKYAIVVLGVPSGDISAIPTDVALVIFSDENLPADLTFESGFLDFPEDASYSSINRTMIASGVDGSTLFRSTIQGELGKWEIYLANDVTVGYTLPDPPQNMDDLAAGELQTLDPITLGGGLGFEDLVTFNGSDLDGINALMTACSRHEL